MDKSYAFSVPVNHSPDMTGIQRIFLNEKTGHRESSLRYTKKSKGIIKGSIGVVQRGAQKKVRLLSHPVPMSKLSSTYSSYYRTCFVIIYGILFIAARGIQHNLQRDLL